MSHRRITFTLSAAASGLLGAAFLPAAAALADTYDYTNYDLTSVGNEVVSDGGIRNFLVEVPPAAAGSIQGTQDFDVTSASGTSLGTVDADVANTTDAFGNVNELIYVTSASNPDGLPVGSVLDTYALSSGFTSTYTEIPTSGGGEDISYSIGGLFGNFNIPTSFDAIAQTQVVPVAGAGAFSGDTFTPVADTNVIEGVNGIPAADYDVLGTQTFEVTNSSGAEIGTFTTDYANSSDILGNTTQDLLVTGSSCDVAGCDIPTTGTVIDYFFSDGSGDQYNVYQDVPSTTGGKDTITDTLHSLFGTSKLNTSFDAAQGLAGVLDKTAGSSLSSAIDVPKSWDITPEGTGTIVGIDGIQPEDIDVQGTQAFDWTNGTQNGTLDADVAKSLIVFGNTTQEQLVVTSSTGAGAPETGSVFEDYTYASGWQQIYSDVVTSSGDKITDTWVTPFGDFNVPDSYDAAANLAGTSLGDGSSAAASDLLSSLDASSFADMFPHLDAALNLLASLF
jgi:hypothetical protein